LMSLHTQNAIIGYFGDEILLDIIVSILSCYLDLKGHVGQNRHPRRGDLYRLNGGGRVWFEIVDFFEGVLRAGGDQYDRQSENEMGFLFTIHLIVNYQQSLNTLSRAYSHHH